jgi:glutamate synthase domain-containing protein 3
VASLRDLIAAHAQATGSARGEEILRDWDELVRRFWKVVPRAVPVGTGTSRAPGAGRERG